MSPDIIAEAIKHGRVNPLFFLNKKMTLYGTFN